MSKDEISPTLFSDIADNLGKDKKPKATANKSTWYFDTAKGVDHMTNTMKTFGEISPEEADKMNKETKLGLIKAEEKRLKAFSNDDVSSYPSDPEQKRILTNIDSLEKSLKIRPDSFKRYARTGALPIVPKGFVSNSDTWEMMKSVGSPEEKREYARMELKDKRETIKRENLQRLEERREKIKKFRDQQEIKQKKSAPAVAMAKEITDAIVKQAHAYPLYDETPIPTKTINTPPVSKAFTGGLHGDFVKQKIDEGKILKEISREIDNEKI